MKIKNDSRNIIETPIMIKSILKKSFFMACYTLYPNLNKNIVNFIIADEISNDEFNKFMLSFKERIIVPLKINETGFMLESDSHKNSMSHFWGWSEKYNIITLKTALSFEPQLIFIGDTRNGKVDNEPCTNDKLKTLNESPFYTFLIEK